MTETQTPDQLRAQAAEYDRDARESFDRSDTDGFLSQWASNITARKLRAEADLMESGGTIEIRALFNLDGTIASTHYGRGHYGAYWRLNEKTARAHGRDFINPSRAQKAATRARNMRAKGFTIGTIRVRGHVTLVGGGGTGTGGCASVYVATLPVIDDLREGRYEVISTTGGDQD